MPLSHPHVDTMSRTAQSCAEVLHACLNLMEHDGLGNRWMACSSNLSEAVGVHGHAHTHISGQTPRSTRPFLIAYSQAS